MPFYQEVKNKYELGPLQHMTSIQNLESILSMGALVAKNKVIQNGTTIVDISNSDVQAGRANKIVPGTNLNLHDFVPLYWGRRTPMSFVNQERNEEIIFLRYSADILQKHDCYLTDGNAYDAKSSFRKFTQLDDIKIVDAKTVNAWYFNQSGEEKRLKQAEVLVFEQLPVSEILDIVCFNDRTRTQVLEILAHHGKKMIVWISQNFYVVKK